MKRSNRLMLLLGVVMAVVAFGAVLMFGGGTGQAQPAPPETVAVVTAVTDIPLGSALAAEQLSIGQRPLTEALDTYRDPSQVVGLVARRSIAAGEVLTTRDFASGATPAALQVIQSLEPGQRAMAVEVDMISGVGALLEPGDFVDVILALSDADGTFPVVDGASFSTDEGPASIDEFVLNTSVKVLVQNVQVLAVIDTADSASGNVVVDPQTGQPVLGRAVVVLSVTPQEAELVRFTQVDGDLSLVLRSPADRDAPDVETTGATLRTLVEQHGVLPPAPVVTEVP